jgi:hypothetical protein
MMNFEHLRHFYCLNRKTILDRGLPWAKFILLSENDPERERVKQQLLKDQNIKKIIGLLSDPKSGIISLSATPADYRVYGSFYWNLYFLADIGLSGNELGIGELIKQLQIQQLEDGQFMVRYHRKKHQTVSLVCITALLTYNLIRLGYGTSNTVTAALNYILTTQRKDGGWHCDRLKQNGEQHEDATSCPAANIHVIRALGQIGKKYETLVKPAIDRIVRIDDLLSLQNCELDTKQYINFNKLRYPPHYTGLDILNVVHSLSFLPGLLKNSKFANLVSLVLNRWDGKNWLRHEKRIDQWSVFDFSQKTGYSEWLTSLFIQAIERVYFKN